MGLLQGPRLMARTTKSPIRRNHWVPLGCRGHLGSVKSVHGGKKPFKCDVCDTAFSAKQDVDRHIKSVHEGRKFKCNECGKAFSRKEILNGHIEKIHEEKKEIQ